MSLLTKKLDKVGEAALSVNSLVNFIALNENPSQWPELIADFKERVHLKQTFSDQMRMSRLLKVLRGDVKQSVQ